MKGRKAVPQKAAPKKAVSKKATSRKAPPKASNRSATKKWAVRREPKKSEIPLAGGEVFRKFTMTVQVPGYEYLADPVAATRRVLILALTKSRRKYTRSKSITEVSSMACATTDPTSTSMEC